MLQADFVQHIAKLAEDGTITGLSDIRDESDRDGMRVVVEMKRGTSAQVCCACAPTYVRQQTPGGSDSHANPSAECLAYSPNAGALAGGARQPLQAHSASEQVCVQHGGAGGWHAADAEPEAVPQLLPGLQARTTCAAPE